MQSVNCITDYHAHIYYDPAKTKEAAAVLRDGIAEAFPDAVIGNWHDEPVGPHLVAMYQVAFATELYERIVPWLSLNRQGLDVLVHPRTGRALADHTEYAIWMGERLPVDEDFLRRHERGET